MKHDETPIPAEIGLNKRYQTLDNMSLYVLVIFSFLLNKEFVACADDFLLCAVVRRGFTLHVRMWQ
jgi:hypothetical protein